MARLFKTDQNASTVPVCGALSIAFQAYRLHWQRQLLAMPHLLFLGLRGLRTSTGHEQGADEVAPMVCPWMTGSLLMAAAPGMTESGHSSPVPDRLPPQRQTKPLDVASLVFQSQKMSLAPIHPMQSKGEGPFALPQSKAARIHSKSPAMSGSFSKPKTMPATGEESLTPASPQNRINRVEAKPALLNPGFDALTDQSPGAGVGLPGDQLHAQSLSPQQSYNDQSGLPFKAGRPDAVKAPAHQDLTRPAELRPGKRTAPEQPDAVAAPATPLTYSAPRPEAALLPVTSAQPSSNQAHSHSNQSVDDAVWLPTSKMERTRRSNPPVAPHTRPPAAMVFPGTDQTLELRPDPLTRPPRERMQVVSEVIETVVDRKFAKKLATVQAAVERTSAGRPAASPHQATSDHALHSDPDRLARRMLRTMTGLYRADRFRSGQIR